ncbi:MAG: hypothetical protein ACQGVK_20770 [Myxococcota bacterium]
MPPIATATGTLVCWLVLWSAWAPTPARADSADPVWRIEQREGGQTTLAILPAQKSLLFAGLPVQPELVVACGPSRTDVWIDFGRPVHPAEAPLRVNLRLDRERPLQATWNIGSDQRRAHMVESRLDSALRVSGGGASAHLSHNATELARRLAEHRRLALRSSTAYGGHLALAFDLGGMNDALRQLADRCAWSASVKAALH